MMAVIVTTCQEFGLMVSESKTETMRLWSAPSSTETTLDIKAAGQRYKQTEKFVYPWWCYHRGCKNVHRNQPPYQRGVGTCPKI